MILNVHTIGELTSLESLDTPDILCEFTNKAVNEIMEKLKNIGLHIAMKDSDWIEWEKLHLDLLED